MGIILSNGQERRSIAMETSKGKKIDNYQIFEISQFEKNQFADYSQQNYPNVIYRSNPSPIYNCHGMSFASRRTNIDRSTDIRNILIDDQYHLIELKDALPGDIVLYVNTEDGDIAHSGMIVRYEQRVNNIPCITVVSKWGKYKEVVHNIYDSPYKGLKIELYRISHSEYGK